MKEDKKIDRILRESLKMERPADDFTSSIMNKIETFDAKEEMALRSLLKKSVLESPSLNFTSRVMTRVERASIGMVSSPIISKKAWIFIGMLISFIFVLAAVTGKENDKTNQVIDGAVQKVDTLLTNSMTFDMPAILTSPLLGLSLFALSSLFLLDYFIRNSRLSLKA